MKSLKAAGSVGNPHQDRDTPDRLQPMDNPCWIRYSSVGMQPMSDSGQAGTLRNGPVGILKGRDTY